jgi:hypothetical protein
MTTTLLRTTRYPVLYLLHGLTGHYSDWFRGRTLLTSFNLPDHRRHPRRK